MNKCRTGCNRLCEGGAGGICEGCLSDGYTQDMTASQIRDHTHGHIAGLHMAMQARQASSAELLREAKEKYRAATAAAEGKPISKAAPFEGAA